MVIFARIVFGIRTQTYIERCKIRYKLRAAWICAGIGITRRTAQVQTEGYRCWLSPRWNCKIPHQGGRPRRRGTPDQRARPGFHHVSAAGSRPVSPNPPPRRDHLGSFGSPTRKGRHSSWLSRLSPARSWWTTVGKLKAAAIKIRVWVGPSWDTWGTKVHGTTLLTPHILPTCTPCATQRRESRILTSCSTCPPHMLLSFKSSMS